MFGFYWVGLVGTGTKITGDIYLPTTPAHKADVEQGTAGWVCQKSWQKYKSSDLHRGRARLPNAAAGVDELNAEGGDRLRSESAAAARAAHLVTNNAMDQVERLESVAAAAREDEIEREAASVAAAEAAAAKVEALQSQLDAVRDDMQQQLHDSEQQRASLQSQLQRVLATQTGLAASTAQQRTIDGKVISGINTVSKVYAALKLELDSEGKPFNPHYSNTSFHKNIADMTDRRVRTMISRMIRRRTASRWFRACRRTSVCTVMTT